MTDIASLQIRVQSLEAEVADRRLGNLARSGQRAERATDGLTSSFKRFIGPAAAGAAAVAGLLKVTNVTRQFEVLNAQLLTATGSAEGAASAFEAIQDFASSTPYDLQQVTESFTKLVNYGLTPSERALTSYGDTASAMGKSLDQLIEAVADAATGEFERLKEFGIKASKQGDQVKFTFRGITETVKFEAGAIEEYLTQLGENNFAGAMANRMDTLDGALSNLGDEWEKLWLNISNLGVGELIEDNVRLAIDVLGELNDIMASGQLEANLAAFASKFSGYWHDMESVAMDVVEMITSMVDFATDRWGEEINWFVDEAIKAIKYLPENFRALVQLMVTELTSFAFAGGVKAAAFVDSVILEIERLYEKSKVYGSAIGEVLDPSNWFDGKSIDIGDALAQVDAQFDSQQSALEKRTEQSIERHRRARLDSIQAILAEREASLKSTRDQFDAAEELRKKYDEARAARRASGEDRLAGFKIGGSSDENEPSEAQAKASAKAAKEAEKAAERREEMMRNEFEQTLESLKSEEQAIADSYNKRLAIIKANTEAGSEFQQKLIDKLNEKFEVDVLGDLGKPDSYQEQIDQLNEFFENRRQLIMENVQLTEEQRTALEAELTTQRNAQLQQLEGARTSAILSTGQQVFDGLAGMAEVAAGKQSTIYQAMFAASKAFAIADAIVKIQTGIASAAALPFPANLPAMATVAAATSSIVSTISSTQYAGAYDEGGHIPSGKIGLVGEIGPELIRGPANVTSRKETAKILDQLNNNESKDRASVTQNVNNTFVINERQDMRTQKQISMEAARAQRRAQARFGS